MNSCYSAAFLSSPVDYSTLASVQLQWITHLGNGSLEHEIVQGLGVGIGGTQGDVCHTWLCWRSLKRKLDLQAILLKCRHRRNPWNSKSLTKYRSRRRDLLQMDSSTQSTKLLQAKVPSAWLPVPLEIIGCAGAWLAVRPPKSSNRLPCDTGGTAWPTNMQNQKYLTQEK